VTVLLIDEPSGRRRIPVNVKGAAIFTYVGNEPPANLDQWKYEFATTRSKITIDFPTALPPGTKVWVLARWQNPRGELGPCSLPASARMAYGLTHLPVLRAA
jgi:hypothetical protein